MRNLILTALLLSAASLFIPTSLFAAGDAKAGAIEASQCMGCHGIPGYNNVYPTYKVPKVGGQNYEYLVAALHEYRNGERDHPTMQVQAESMSDEEIENIAAYFSSLGGE